MTVGSRSIEAVDQLKRFQIAFDAIVHFLNGKGFKEGKGEPIRSLLKSNPEIMSANFQGHSPLHEALWIFIYDNNKRGAPQDPAKIEDLHVDTGMIIALYDTLKKCLGEKAAQHLFTTRKPLMAESTSHLFPKGATCLELIARCSRASELDIFDSFYQGFRKEHVNELLNKYGSDRVKYQAHGLRGGL